MHIHVCVYVHDMHVKDFFFFASVSLIYSCATERPGLGAGFGALCSELYFAAGPLAVHWGRMQQCCAPYREVFSGLANTGKFTGIIIPV